MPSVNLGKVKGDKGVSLRNRGEWNSTTKYLNDANYIDMVSHNGNLWTCLVTNTNVEPAEASDKWNLSAKSVSNVYFEEAAERQNIVSGEQVSVSFGKISKWFSTIKDAAFKSVVNSLLTTEDGFVLDARQGKVLKDEIDSLNSNLGYTIEKTSSGYVKKYTDGRLEAWGSFTKSGFKYTQIGSSGVCYAGYNNAFIGIVPSSVESIICSAQNAGVVWHGGATLSGQEISGQVIQYGSTDRATTISYQIKGRWK